MWRIFKMCHIFLKYSIIVEVAAIKVPSGLASTCHYPFNPQFKLSYFACAI